MPDNNPTNSSRRAFLQTSGNFVAGAVAGGLFGGCGNDVYLFLKGMATGLKTSVPEPRWSDLLFGEMPSNTAIIPPGTNRLALAQGKIMPSRYVRKAFEVATATHKNYLGIDRELGVDTNNEALEIQRHQNLLVLGGPVATDISKLLCGYRDIQSLNENAFVPVPISNSTLPFYFYVGDENGYGYWNGEKRVGRRWHENGMEKFAPLYGVMEGTSGIPIPSPMDGDRVAGDMLMITRVPNPNDIKGSIVVIGGLHGYSLESFFSNLDQNIKQCNDVLNFKAHDYFQALIPYSISSDRTVSPAWAGIGSWEAKLTPIDPMAYLASFAAR